ncbi:MAG: hypothetical protein V9E90_03575 [Saprospiraceae bacterium]|nr:hypothetical protein [Saprospiraceae bacterium]
MLENCNQYYAELLNVNNYRLIKYNARHFKTRSKDKKVWDSYEFHLNYFRKNNINRESLILAMNVAYSWMPTMLNIYKIKNTKDWKKLVNDVKFLSCIKTFKDFEKFEDKILDSLVRLSSTINNSIVGASKVLHLFSPKYIPIIDSRVIKAWNFFFSDFSKRNKGIVHLTSKPEKYLEYWKAILYWKTKVPKSSVREIEKFFFDFGGFRPFDRKVHLSKRKPII